MSRDTRDKIIPWRGGSDAKARDEADADLNRELSALQTGSLRLVPAVYTSPRLPPAIADEILDYFGWVFCQGGFLGLHMTFEQFLAVVFAVSPAALSPGYDGEGSDFQAFAGSAWGDYRQIDRRARQSLDYENRSFGLQGGWLRDKIGPLDFGLMKSLRQRGF